MHPEQPLVPAHDDIGLLCMVVANGFSAAVLDRLAAAGFGDARLGHGFVVQGLLAGDTTVTQLADRLAVSVQAVSKTVREMERLGYVEKAPNPADGRAQLLRLSARALASVAESRRARLAVQQQLLEALGPGRAQHTLDALRLLAGQFGGLESLANRRLRPSGSL